MKKLLLFIVFANLGIIVLNAQTIDQIYLEAIKSKFPNFEKSIEQNNGVFIDEGIVTLFIDSNGNKIGESRMPPHLTDSDQYRYRIVLLTTKDDSTSYKSQISNVDTNTIFKNLRENPVKFYNIVKFYISDTSDILRDKVIFRVRKDVSKNDLFRWEINLISSKTYLETIKRDFPNFEKSIKKNNGVYIDEKIATLFIDSKGNKIEGTLSPTVLKESSQYRYRLIILTTPDDEAIYEVKISGKEYNPKNDFVILNTSDDLKSKKQGRQKEDKVKTIISDTSDVFSEKVYFKVKKKLGEKEIDLYDWEIKLTPSNNYHVSIMGGYFHSNLDNPNNIIKAPLPNSSDSTLIGDFTGYQRKVTIMAVFYPWERTSDYKWRELRWYETISVGFGLGIDEDLFDDLFLGINLEFARGGNISGGVHYGKHNVLATNPDFDYGTDVWNGTFDNSLVKEEWMPTWYVGVTIDLRVINSLINSREKLNKSKND